jgi:hypothetical protein
MTNLFSYTGTTNGSANTASSFTLSPRWNYITIIASGATGFWARTDGNAAVETGNDDLSVWVGPGEDVLVANMLPLWTQAALVIQGNASSGYTANMDYNGQSLWGGTTNPGTSVSLISTVASMPFTIMAAG